MNTIYVITATIKILFLVFFGKTFFSKNVGCSTKIILFFIFLGYGITNLCNMPSWTKCAIPDTRENNKTCFANQKILLGAIEMYNMDVPNDQKIKTLDNEAIINKLVEKNYLNKKNQKKIVCFYLKVI